MRASDPGKAKRRPLASKAIHGHERFAWTTSKDATSTRFIVASYAIRYRGDSVSIEARGFVLRRNWIPVIASGAIVVLGLLATRAPGDASLFGYLAAWFGIMFGPILYL